MTTRRSRLLSSLLLVSALGLSAPALARSDKTFAYPRDEAWPAAVRFLVVDEHLKVTDKDADAGYAVFELKDGGKTYRGALECVATTKDGRPVVSLVITIEDRPSWMEIAMLTRLEAKLRAELGPPAPAPSKSHEPAKPTDGKPTDGKPTEGKPPETKPPADGAPPISSTP